MSWWVSLLFLLCPGSAYISCHKHDKYGDPKNQLAHENRYWIQDEQFCAIWRINPKRKQNHHFDRPRKKCYLNVFIFDILHNLSFSYFNQKKKLNHRIVFMKRRNITHIHQLIFDLDVENQFIGIMCRQNCDHFCMWNSLQHIFWISLRLLEYIKCMKTFRFTYTDTNQLPVFSK